MLNDGDDIVTDTSVAVSTVAVGGLSLLSLLALSDHSASACTPLPKLIGGAQKCSHVYTPRSKHVIHDLYPRFVEQSGLLCRLLAMA